MNCVECVCHAKSSPPCPRSVSVHTCPLGKISSWFHEHSHTEATEKPTDIKQQPKGGLCCLNLPCHSALQLCSGTSVLTRPHELESTKSNDRGGQATHGSTPLGWWAGRPGRPWTRPPGSGGLRQSWLLLPAGMSWSGRRARGGRGPHQGAVAARRGASSRVRSAASPTRCARSSASRAASIRDPTRNHTPFISDSIKGSIVSAEVLTGHGPKRFSHW